MENDSSDAIPKDAALRLCDEIRKEKGGKWFSQCWGCLKFSKGDPPKMCVSSRPDYRGCNLVNVHYDRSRKSG